MHNANVTILVCVGTSFSFPVYFLYPCLSQFIHGLHLKVHNSLVGEKQYVTKDVGLSEFTVLIKECSQQVPGGTLYNPMSPQEMICEYALFTAAPSLIFNENDSEAVRDRLASLQWALLLFNAFSDCSPHETLEKYLSKKCQLTKNSRQCEKF